MPDTRYHISVGPEMVIEAELDTELPVRLLINELVTRHRLPLVKSSGVADGYRLFGGTKRRLISTEQTLAQTLYAQDGQLILAQSHALWWAPVAPARKPSQAAAVRPRARGIPIKAVAVGTPVIALLVLAWLIFPRPQLAATGSAQSHQAPTVAPSAPPTTTLPPATPTPAASPTPDPQALADQAYNDGLVAYDARDWSSAEASFQQVYAFNPAYGDIREKRAATNYNWGVQLLGLGDVSGAHAKFAEALTIEPAHQPALEQEQRSRLYLEGVSAQQEQDWPTSIARFEELRSLQADFLDSAELLYTAYVSYGARLEGQKQSQKALAIYRAAAALSVADTSQARQRIAAIEPARFSGRIYEQPTDSAIQCGTAYESKIWGVVKDRKGKGIGGAVVRIASTDGSNSYQATTNSQGGFEIPGLGCTTWLVQLIGVPGSSNGLQVSSARVNLNGGLYSGAGVEFRQQ